MTPPCPSSYEELKEEIKIIGKEISQLDEEQEKNFGSKLIVLQKTAGGMMDSQEWRDWRDHAFSINAWRLSFVERSRKIFLSNQGQTAKELSNKALIAEKMYAKFNRLVMLLLEEERLPKCAEGIPFLDLHSFHCNEVEGGAVSTDEFMRTEKCQHVEDCDWCREAQ